MSNTIIQAIKVNLQGEYTEDTTIGLYTAAGASYLRVSEATLTGTTLAWTPGLILKGGIGDIDASGSLERGGNIADYSGLRVSLANAEKLMQSLKDLQINLIGLPVTVHEFVGTIADSDSVSEDTIFTGVVENIAWGDTIATINLKNSLYKRETNLSSVAENGVTIPVTIGKMYPPDSTVINNLAKFVRTKDDIDEDTYSEKYFTGVDSGIKIFPVSALPALNPAFYQATLPTAPTFSYVMPEDLYVIVIDGTGNNQIRQISSMTPSSGNTFTFIVKDVFTTQLSITADDRSWVQFVYIKREYLSDTFKCKDFIDALTGLATSKEELYSYDSTTKEYNRIADYGVTVSSDTNKNFVEIDGQQYSENINNLSSFLIKPATSFALIDDATLENWIGFVGTPKVIDGIYSDDLASASGSLVNPTQAYDKDSTTYAQHDVTVVPSALTNRWTHAFKFGLPTFGNKINATKFYLGIKVGTNYDAEYAGADTTFQAHFNRFAYTKYTDRIVYQPSDRSYNITTNGGIIIDDLPDYYYSDLPETSNLNFYRENAETSPGHYDKLTGYTFFEIPGIDSIEKYKTLVSGCILVSKACPLVASIQSIIDIHEVAIIAKLADADISKEVYIPVSGRVFNDTFESRKTATDLIENPVDVIEHTRRLQNWSELGGTVVEWGKEYAANALIKLADDGSFDSPNLAYVTNQTCAMQITDTEKAKTNSLVKKLCDLFDLCTYIDQDGYECIETIQPYATAPTETILLTDQHGAIGDIEEPKVENIYCEPVINYLYDQGAGAFAKTAKVTNIDSAAWAAAYTPGYTLADGELIWNLCKALHTKYRHIEPCPAEFSDLYFIRDYAVAVEYIKRKLAWMEKPHLPTLNIAYSKGKDYNIYKHVMVQLPVHTNNVLVECIIDKITKSKTRGIVQIEAAIIGEIET